MARQGATLYRVDLNRIVSKYIGETEKNLDAVSIEEIVGVLGYKERLCLSV